MRKGNPEYCPNCRSENVKLERKSSNKNVYRCLNKEVVCGWLWTSKKRVHWHYQDEWFKS